MKCALVVVAAVFVYQFCVHQYLESHPVYICQHPDGIINLTPYANLSGDTRYASCHACTNALNIIRISAGFHCKMGMVLPISTTLVRHFISITVGMHM